MKLKELISLLIILLFSINITAQVTIGSGEEPGDGSLLDLKETGQEGINAHKGLGLPRVGLSSSHPTTPAELSASIGGSGDWDMEEHIGLMVYNVTENQCLAKGIYVWDGEYWSPLKKQEEPVLQRTQDSLALVALYNSTDGPNWINNANWLSAQPIDTWRGVKTEPQIKCIKGEPVSDLSVTGLTFPGDMNLTGTIPVELENLSNLKSLYIHDHKLLTGTIPAELGNLANLRVLSLFGNNFTGSIPAELGNLVNLSSLALNGNTLTGTIPAELGNLTNLEILNITGNNLTGTIPSELGNLTKLILLHVEGNKLAGTLPASWTQIRDIFACPQFLPDGTTNNPDPWTNWQCP